MFLFGFRSVNVQFSLVNVKPFLLYIVWQIAPKTPGKGEQICCRFFLSWSMHFFPRKMRGYDLKDTYNLFMFYAQIVYGDVEGGVC